MRQAVCRWHQLWKGAAEVLETWPRGCFCPDKHLVPGSEWTLYHMEPWVKHLLS